MKNFVKFIIVGLFIFTITNSLFAVEIKLPITSDHEKDEAYKIGLLKLALEKVKGNHKITTNANTIHTQARITNELINGSKWINLHWMGTSSKLEKELLPIRVPIYRGLLGYRVFLIHKGSQAQFDHVKTLVDLQKYKGSQGFGWSDIEILEYSGLKQYPAKYENIFKMINAGRIDYFSRGVSEAFKEVASRKDELPNLFVEEKILLVYPFAMFFFTSRSNKELAEILEEGFRKASEDGSLNDYFYNHPEIKSAFKQANIDNRIRIEIPNPFLSPETLSIPNEYWHGR